MSLIPLYDRVIVRRDEPEHVTKSGIVLPGAGDKQNRGTVLAVGHGKLMDNGELRQLTIQPGDRVVFGPYSGNNVVKVEGEELLVMAESEILAIEKRAEG